MIASLILALFLAGFVSATEAATFLYVYGAFLIIAEFGVFSFGLIGFNGLLSLGIAYAIHNGGSTILGLPIGWELWFGMAFVELLLAFAVTFVFVRSRTFKTTTGNEAMIGKKASIVSWVGQDGMVVIGGENWKAASDTVLDLEKGETVFVEAVEGLTVRIRAS